MNMHILSDATVYPMRPYEKEKIKVNGCKFWTVSLFDDQNVYFVS